VADQRRENLYDSGGEWDHGDVSIFVLEDDFHDDLIAESPTREEAWREVQKRAHDPTSVENRAPCTSWPTCRRDYAIVEYDNSKLPWQELSRRSVLTIEQGRAIWSSEPNT
jgi:hypothetical protein